MPWLRVKLRADELRLRLEAHHEPYPIERVDVQANDETVVITLYRCMPDGPRVRYDTLYPEYADVQLKAPLAGRAVHDGATGNRHELAGNLSP
ncbi:MAG: hypothetical protein M3P40_10135 [Actinomycetota bacterium]|nr:hypothetical protein [Actinomycetota bacterium]